MGVDGIVSHVGSDTVGYSILMTQKLKSKARLRHVRCAFIAAPCWNFSSNPCLGNVSRSCFRRRASIVCLPVDKFALQIVTTQRQERLRRTEQMTLDACPNDETNRSPDDIYSIARNGADELSPSSRREMPEIPNVEWSAPDLRALVGKLKQDVAFHGGTAPGSTSGEVDDDHYDGVTEKLDYPSWKELNAEREFDDSSEGQLKQEKNPDRMLSPADVLAESYLDDTWGLLPDDDEAEMFSKTTTTAADLLWSDESGVLSESSLSSHENGGVDDDSLPQLIAFELPDVTDDSSIFGNKDVTVESTTALGTLEVNSHAGQKTGGSRGIEECPSKPSSLKHAHARVIQRRRRIEEERKGTDLESARGTPHHKWENVSAPLAALLQQEEQRRFEVEAGASRRENELERSLKGIDSGKDSTTKQQASKRFQSRHDHLNLPFQPVDRMAQAEMEDLAAALQALESIPLASAKLPKCSRCHAPTRQADLDSSQQNICTECYRQIHLVRDSVAALCDQDPHGRYRNDREKAEVAALEEDVTTAARLVTLSHIAGRGLTRGTDTSTPGMASTNEAKSTLLENEGEPDNANLWKKGSWEAVEDKESASVSSTGTQSSESVPATRRPPGRGPNQQSGAADAMGGSSDADVPGPRHPAGHRRGRGWSVRASDRSLRTINPIRQLVQGISGRPNPAKEYIDLSVGDPTKYGNLEVADDILDEFCSILHSGKCNGYTESMGALETRRAVSERYTLPNAPLTDADVILTSGVSGALELALGALANEGDNVLLPQPGFPLFRTILDGFGVECRYYRVLPDHAWEVAIDDLARLADDRTVAIVINNPSNPCGSVFSASHLKTIVDAAAELCLPIVADEVYADMVFGDQSFVSVASVSRDVPVLSVGGISKQFVVPGWRLGWLLVHDRHGVLEAGRVREGIRRLTTRMLIPNAPTQAVVPHMLSRESKSGDVQKLMKTLESNAMVLMEGLRDAVGIRIVQPQGSMYLMVEIDVDKLGFEDDLAFTKALRLEESVFVLPGACFQAPNFVRMVFCAPAHILREAASRIKDFCALRAVTPSSVAV
jgi:tyrosine aminotransferase